jgi:hypothetical protein
MERSIDLYKELKQYISQTRSDFELKQSGGVYFSIANTGQRGGGKKWFNIGLTEIIQTLEDVKTNLPEFLKSTRYDEKEWRDLGGQLFTHDVARSLITVQTKPFFTMLAKIFHWATGEAATSYSDQVLKLTPETLETTINKLKAMSANLTPDSIIASTPEIIASSEEQRNNQVINTINFDEAFEAAVLQTGFATQK